MSNIVTDIKKCKDYSSILDDIKVKLDSEKIVYSQSSKHEIIVENKSQKEIESIISTLPIPKIIIFLMIDIISAKNKVFIRKKMK